MTSGFLEISLVFFSIPGISMKTQDFMGMESGKVSVLLRTFTVTTHKVSAVRAAAPGGQGFGCVVMTVGSPHFLLEHLLRK